MLQLLTDLDPFIHQGAFTEALSKLKSAHVATAFLAMCKRITANLLLASGTAAPEDFEVLISDGKLDASPWSPSLHLHIPPGSWCVSTVTPEAAAALQTLNVKCLDLQGNSRLDKLPVKELCDITSLVKLECANCLQLLSIPLEVAALGGTDTMLFLREYARDGAYNEALSLFLVGGGENGKTSLLHALMNETGNSAQSIGIDTRTVGMDMAVWKTKDTAGRDLELQTKDVGGQDLYMHLHELFVLPRGIYLLVWRADCAAEKTRKEATAWLNLLQARVPGVTVLAVVTHVDCVSTEILQQQSALVKDAFEEWEAKQANSQNAQAVPVVRVLNDGESYPVNCLTGHGIPELRSALLYAAEKTRGFREPLPATWRDLRDKLGEMRKTTKYMGWKEFTLLVKECNIADNMLLAVTAFMHETLVLRFFGLPLIRQQTQNFEDFLTVLLGGMRDSAHVEGARALFDRIDTDGSGAIDKKELREFMQAAGLKPNDTNLRLMMQSVDDDGSGEIEFEEFRKRFDNAKGAVKGDVLSSTVYLDADWMADVLKGVIRHDHAALHEFLQAEKETGLMHQARRMRVQGIISNALLDNNLLWPGAPSSSFWCKVASDSSTKYTYEKGLWDDGAGGLKKVVESEDDKSKAMGLLEGFKIILPVSPARSEFLCPDLVPPHVRSTSNSVSLDAVLCEHYLVRTFKELPFGFWNILFMEIQSISTSGSASTRIQTHFQLSAKIQIMQTPDIDLGLQWKDITGSAGKLKLGTEITHKQLAAALRRKDAFTSDEFNKFKVFNLSHGNYIKVGKKYFQAAGGNIRIDLRASTSSAFEMAKTALAKVSKFYPGMASWEVSQEDISAEDSAKIIEPAQVLVMTAAALLHKNADAIASFNDAMAKVEANLDTVKKFIEEARTTVAENQEKVKSIEKLLSNVDYLEALRSRLNNPDADHFTGTSSLAVISAEIDHFITSVILPEYQKCLREVKRQAPAPRRPKNTQVVDASSAPSFHKLDKELFNALKKGKEGYRAEAQRLLHQCADPSFTSSSFFCWSKSSVAEANRRNLQDLFHSFGCDDPDLKTSPLSEIGQGKQLKKCLDPFSQPRSVLPQVLEGDKMTSSMEWIEKLYSVIETHFPSMSISKEIYSPYSLFDGRAQVVLVLLDEASSRSDMWCDRFRELNRQGCKIVGVPMPGFAITNFSKWWPENMPEFKDHSLFFDCRLAQGDELKEKMRDELMPQIHQFLEEWKPPHIAPGAGTMPVPLDPCIPGSPAPGPLGKRVYASKEALRECVLPCPCCLQLQTPHHGVFKRDECMLSFMSKHGDTNTKGTLFCNTCQQKVKVKDILKRPLFLSYNWGKDLSTQKIAKPLCERVFLVTEMPYWLDIDGGMGFGDELVTEMREGVAGCDIVILMISDAFCNSGNCLFEFINIIQNAKHVIPLLVPNRGDTRTGPSGWTGQFQGKDWWKHAQDICNPQRSDLLTHPKSASFKDIQWNYLAEFTPIDLRNESFKVDGSLQDNSAAEKEIILRIMSRFFRPSVQSGSVH